MYKLIVEVGTLSRAVININLITIKPTVWYAVIITFSHEAVKVFHTLSMQDVI
jgi:hypothetical protein